MKEGSGWEERFRSEDKVEVGILLTSSVMSALSSSRDDQFLADPVKEDSASSRGMVRWPRPDSSVTWTTCGVKHLHLKQF